MEEWTRDASKFGQMVSETSTALGLYRNIGKYTSKNKFPKGTVCIACDSPMVQAEHLINKAHGGNHTRYNVIPVCKNHVKPGKKAYDIEWWKAYSEQDVETIKLMTTESEEDRMNPYHEQNLADTDDIKNQVSALIQQLREQKGLI